MTQENPSASIPTLTLEDILADLALLSNDASTADDDPQKPPRHPLLSLGRSLVPPDSLTRSELERTESDVLDDSLSLEDQTTRLKRLLRSLDDHPTSESKQNINVSLEIVQLFLSSSQETLASLNQNDQLEAGVPSENQIDGLHSRIARVQSQLDQLERDLEAAKRRLEG